VSDDAAYWSAHSSYRDADSPSARAFADPKAERIARLLGLRGDEPVLDVGAGTGHLGEAFRRRGHPVTAIDLTRAMLARNPASRRLVADGARLPFADAAFPLVIEASVLHHVADPVAVLREMARVSAGPVVAVEPNRNHPPMFVFSLLLREEWPALRFTPTHVARLGRRARLAPLDVAATGWVYQNKTPARLAGVLARYNRPCPVAAYTVAVFRQERDR